MFIELIKQTIKNFLKKFNLALIHNDYLERLMKNDSNFAFDIALLTNSPQLINSPLVACVKKSRSQIRQDVFVLSELNFKKNGFFVDFGATNGIDLSNSYLLEKDFGWNGILVEPAHIWHKDLLKNRTSKIDISCVSSQSGRTVSFNEVSSPELSTIDEYSKSDLHSKDREKGSHYDVTTISLVDLLDKYNAPAEIDYLSIDTEGSEFDILNNFDFSKYKFNVITCEHNYTPAREKIHNLLTRNGYQRKYGEFSDFDDWYIRVR